MFLANKSSTGSKPACLKWAVILSCVKALELLHNDYFSLMSSLQTVRQYSVTFYCLYAGLCWQSFFINSLWCRVKLENCVFILPGSSAVKIWQSMFFMKWNWICFITVHVCGLYTRLTYLLNRSYFATFQNKRSVIQLDMKHTATQLLPNRKSFCELCCH